MSVDVAQSSLPTPHRCTVPATRDAMVALEVVEARAWSALYEAPSNAIRRAAGVSLSHLGGATAGAAASFDVLAFNRVVELDPSARLDAILIASLAEHYRGLGLSRAFLPWPATSPPPPASLPRLPGVEVVLHNRWVKLGRNVTPPRVVRSGFDFASLGAGDVEAVTSVLATAFDFPPPLAAIFAAAVGVAGWRHFGLADGGRLVAVAGLYLTGETGWLGPAATLPSHRGRGAQQELLGRRIEAAAAAGCRLLSVETAEPTPERPVASYRNVRRLGFVELYRRPNYRLELTPG